MTQEEKTELMTFLRERNAFYKNKLRKTIFSNMDRVKIAHYNGILKGINIALSKIGEL